MGSRPSQPPSFFTVYAGVPHSLSCNQFSHSCTSTAGPSGKDATLPWLHRQAIHPQEIWYPRLHKYYDSQEVWVDDWKRVTLVERVPGFRYYVCVGHRGKGFGWIWVPESATLPGLRGREGVPTGMVWTWFLHFKCTLVRPVTILWVVWVVTCSFGPHRWCGVWCGGGFRCGGAEWAEWTLFLFT